MPLLAMTARCCEVIMNILLMKDRTALKNCSNAVTHKGTMQEVGIVLARSSHVHSDSSPNMEKPCLQKKNGHLSYLEAI